MGVAEHAAEKRVTHPGIDRYITRTSSGQTYTTSKFGDGTITRDGKGNTWTTSKFGDGSITRGAWLWHVCDRANLAFPKLPALWAVSSIVLFEMRSRSEWCEIWSAAYCCGGGVAIRAAVDFRLPHIAVARNDPVQWAMDASKIQVRMSE